MESEIRKLNYECNYNIFMIKSMMDKNFQSQNDRAKILFWIKKLQKCNSSIDEMNLRNHFIYYLLACVKNVELRPPFSDMPPPGAIDKYTHYLPTLKTDGDTDLNTDWIEDLQKNETNFPDIYRKSPDGGVFLSSQPIPKCGAFCYVAIVGKSAASNETEQ